MSGLDSSYTVTKMASLRSLITFINSPSSASLAWEAGLLDKLFSLYDSTISYSSANSTDSYLHRLILVCAKNLIVFSLLEGHTDPVGAE